MTVTKLSTFKIATAALLLLAPAMLATPAAADNDTQVKSATHATHHAHNYARNHVRNSYASVPSSAPFTIGDDAAGYAGSYHCGIGLMNTPLPCERDN